MCLTCTIRNVPYFASADLPGRDTNFCHATGVALIAVRSQHLSIAHTCVVPMLYLCDQLGVAIVTSTYRLNVLYSTRCFCKKHHVKEVPKSPSDMVSKTSMHFDPWLFVLPPTYLCLQRHDDASQQSVSNSGTPKWAEVDEPMDFSQPVFGDAMPPQQDHRRVSHLNMCPGPCLQHNCVVTAAVNSLYRSLCVQKLSMRPCTARRHTKPVQYCSEVVKVVFCLAAGVDLYFSVLQSTILISFVAAQSYGSTCINSVAAQS